MGWFDEQIRQRIINDDEVFTDSFIRVAGSVMGKKLQTALNDERQQTKDAIDEILKFYHIKSREVPDNIKDADAQMEYLFRPHGIMRRTVELTEGWYQDATGAMLGVRKDNGKVVALVPTGSWGYSFLDTQTGKRVRLDKKTAALFEPEALVFYKPFPLKKLNMGDLVRYIVGTLSVSDAVLFAAATLAVVLVGMLLPQINSRMFSDVVEAGDMQVLAAISTFLICVSVSSLLLTTIRSMLEERINQRLGMYVEAATMMRILSLPTDFFKNYAAGDLANRAAYMTALCKALVSVFLSTGLTSVFSLAYITQIFLYAPSLVVPALTVIAVTLLLTVVSSLVQIRITRRQMQLATKENGMSYSLITGLQKIRLSGAEKRVFARWARLYAESAELQYNPPLFLKLNTVLTTTVTLLGTLAIYAAAIRSGVSVSDYYAFNTAYGMVSGAFVSLAGVALTAAKLKPILEIVSPFMETVPEISEGKTVITKLSGGIEVSNVSFRYQDSMPLVLDNLSLKIRPGQYVAIVGATGCGKSTLMRILLGFEKPQKGAVYYDGKDLNAIDQKSLRQKIGVVMQNASLFQGDIFSNIIISAPDLTLKDAWDAAEKSGVADDIRRMPMGMNTIISEGQGGISGGQKQRLMIARAIAPQPKILMFDEATSALDNITQKIVSESLASMKCTRIVIAHRLSTIQQCDRIIVLDKGRIAEDGTYEELLAHKGYFAELVERQRLDIGA